MHFTDKECMELAIATAARSRMEATGVHPYVGAVLVHQQRRFTAYRGEKALGDHAEYTVLAKKLKGRIVTDATVYTTLEPCTTRNHPKVPCAQRLVDSKVARVVIGMLDPNQDICGRGVRLLRKHGVAVEFFPTKLMKKVEAQSQSFIRAQEAEDGLRILCGLGQRHTPYNFLSFADDKTRELILVAQNLRTMLSKPTFLRRLRELLIGGTRIRLILTTYEVMSAISPAAAIHFAASVKDLAKFYWSLRPQKRKLFSVHFSIAAASLSLQVRDPTDRSRAQIVFNPKWATDSEPENRLYCVLKLRDHEALFDKLYGAIDGMDQADALDLEGMCLRLDVPWGR